MPQSVILLTSITIYTFLNFLLIEDNGQSGLFLDFYSCIASIFYIVLIILPMFLTSLGVFSHISGPQRPLPINTIQTITFQVYLHRL